MEMKGENSNPIIYWPEISSQISAVAAYGHTPGHTVYLLESVGKKLLIIGDLLHVAPVQFHVPSINATYDMDASSSASIRRQILSYAAQNKIPVGAIHVAYPGIVTLEAENMENGFDYTPVCN